MIFDFPALAKPATLSRVHKSPLLLMSSDSWWCSSYTGCPEVVIWGFWLTCLVGKIQISVVCVGLCEYFCCLMFALTSGSLSLIWHHPLYALVFKFLSSFLVLDLATLEQTPFYACYVSVYVCFIQVWSLPVPQSRSLVDHQTSKCNGTSICPWIFNTYSLLYLFSTVPLNVSCM